MGEVPGRLLSVSRQHEQSAVTVHFS